MRRRSLPCVSAVVALLILPGLAGAQAPSPAPSPTRSPAVTLIASSLVATRAAQSLHVSVTASGSIAGGPDGSTTIDDASMEADLDIAGQAFWAQATAPSLEIDDLQVRIVDGQAYLWLDNPELTGTDEWLAFDGPMMVDAILAMIPGGRRIVLDSPGQDRLEMVLQRRLTRAEATATILTNQACAAGTCTTVRITAPLEADASDLFGLFGGLGGPVPGEPAASDAPSTTTTLDILVDTATGRLDSVVLAQGTGEQALMITVAMSAYGEPVTIEAPPADQVSDLGLD